MIAGTNATKQLHQHLALRQMTRQQQSQIEQGRQKTFSQSEIARRMNLSRSRVEQLELMAKLKLLQGLAREHPQSLLELGATYAHLAFLKQAKITSSTARTLWRQWSEIDQPEPSPEDETLAAGEECMSCH